MDIYSILSHPFRRKILNLLEKEGFIPYTVLMDKLGLDQTGQLNFHLKKLGNLIDKDKKSYFLTEDGKRIIRIMNLNKRVLSGEDIEYLNNNATEINRIGVILCNCNTEISNVININALQSYLEKINNVVSVQIFDNLCQEKNLDKITNWIKENFINKITIAACSPKTHQHIFERIFEGIIDRSNIEIANIRENCCWVHYSSEKHMDSLITLNKAQLLIEAAIERVSLQREVKLKRVEVEKSCAIIGGGIAGMTLALNLSRAGIRVYIIEKSPTLGGKIARWSRISNIGDCSICFMSELIGEIVKEKNIEIYTNTEIENVSGEVGNFSIDLIQKPRFVDESKCTGCKQCIEVCGREQKNQYEYGLTKRKVIYIPFQNAYPYVPIIDEIDHETCLDCRICERACINKAINLNQQAEQIKIRVGAKIIAIGADISFDLEEYSYNPYNNIITSAEFERMLSSDGFTGGKISKLNDKGKVNSISIIQEVGPSNYLCEYSDILALKYIDAIKLQNPNCEVNVFYDLSKLTIKGEILLKSTNQNFIYANHVSIETREDINYVIADSIEFPSDLIILNLELIPNKDIANLRKFMHLTINDKGFMSEETLASGIYGIGTIYGPLNYNSTISSSNNVALKIISLLSKDYLYTEFSGIEINHDKCGLCGLCVNSCDFNAINIEVDKIKIDKFKCKGCGTCVAICPTNAIEMNINTSEKIFKTLEIFSKFKSKPKIIAFCCQSCGYAAADDAGLKKILYNPNTFIIKVPCTGRVDTEFILKSFELGFNGVMILGCSKNSCRYINGIEKAQKKVHLLKQILEPNKAKRIIIKSITAIEGQKFADISNKFYEQLSRGIKNNA